MRTHHLHWWITSRSILVGAVSMITLGMSIEHGSSPIEVWWPILGIIIAGYGTCVKMACTIFILLLVVAVNSSRSVLNPVSTGP